MELSIDNILHSI